MDVTVEKVDSVDFRRPTLQRSVLSENRALLLRRWKLVKAGLLDDSKAIDRWFPGQRDLLELLAVADEAHVLDMAACTIPLFSVTLPIGLEPGLFLSKHAETELEAENFEEIFLALSVRLDALRLATPQAAVIFGLTNQEVTRTSRFGPHELHALAKDPMMHMYQVAGDSYFTSVMTKQMTESEKTMLATVSRRPKDASFRC